MKISVSELTALVNKAIANQGYDKPEAKIISGILLYAQFRGNNQGVVKLIGKGIPKRKTAKSPKVATETPVSALFDGNHTHAMIVMDRMTDVAIKKAKKSGVGITGNYNSSESTGALGYYAKKVADAGFIGIVYAAAPFQTTAPHGSTEAKYCTNPVAYGIPTQRDPIILDMSTSAMAYYGLIEAKTASNSVPEGIGYDKAGKPTTDPAEIMSGALRTIAGHKGSGLALIGQIFAGALVRADSFDNSSDNAGNLVMAIDPSILTPRKQFTKEVSSIAKRIKSAKKENGVKEILMPGERGNTVHATTMKTKSIEIEKNLLKGLQEAAA